MYVARRRSTSAANRRLRAPPPAFTSSQRPLLRTASSRCAAGRSVAVAVTVSPLPSRPLAKSISSPK